MTWQEEDEYMEIENMNEETNGFGQVQESTSKDLPEGVLVRMNAFAERTGKKPEEARQMYLDYIKEHYGVDDYTQESDEDLLIDWAEQVFTETRKQGGGSNANLSTWVGEFVGVQDRARDRLERILASNIKLYQNDPNEAIGSGRLGVFEKTGANWSLHTKNGVKKLEASSDENPPFGVKVDQDWVCLTSYNDDPAPYKRMGRYYYFLGNEEEKFVKQGEVALWRIDLNNELSNLEVDIGRPCKIQVVPPREKVNENFKDVLGTYRSFEIEYTDDFVADNVKPLLNASKFWTSRDLGHDYYVHIDELEEAFETRKESGMIDGEKKSWGPLVFTRGMVSTLNTEPRESEYDPEGHNYSMTLTSSITGDMTCWISGAVGKLTTPFKAGWGDDAFDIAENSTVLVFGRLGMKEYNGVVSPKMTVMGVYADPRRSRRRATGGNTGVGQFD